MVRFSKGLVFSFYSHLLGAGAALAVVSSASAPRGVSAGIAPSSCVVVVSVALTVAARTLASFLSKCGAVGWLGHQGLGVDDLAKGLRGGVVIPEVGGLALCAGCSVFCMWGKVMSYVWLVLGCCLPKCFVKNSVRTLTVRLGVSVTHL